MRMVLQRGITVMNKRDKKRTASIQDNAMVENEARGTYVYPYRQQWYGKYWEEHGAVLQG